MTGPRLDTTGHRRHMALMRRAGSAQQHTSCVCMTQRPGSSICGVNTIYGLTRYGSGAAADVTSEVALQSIKGVRVLCSGRRFMCRSDSLHYSSSMRIMAVLQSPSLVAATACFTLLHHRHICVHCLSLQCIRDS